MLGQLQAGQMKQCSPSCQGYTLTPEKHTEFIPHKPLVLCPLFGSHQCSNICEVSFVIFKAKL